MGDLFNTLNKSLPWRSSMPLEGQFLCCALSVLAIALYKNFPQNVLVSSSFWSPRKRRHGPCMYVMQQHQWEVTQMIKPRDFTPCMKAGTRKWRVQAFYDVWYVFYRQLGNLQVFPSYQYKLQMINAQSGWRPDRECCVWKASSRKICRPLKLQHHTCGQTAVHVLLFKMHKSHYWHFSKLLYKKTRVWYLGIKMWKSWATRLHAQHTLY